MVKIRRFCLVVWVVIAGGVTVRAQQAPTTVRPGTIAIDVSVALANGWALLAEGRADRAAIIAAGLLASDPRNPATLGLAVEAEIARAGAAEALTLYERWLGTRPDEEPLVLRRVAAALLTTAGQPSADVEVRLEALKALVSDGDAWASRTLVEAAKGGSESDLRALAALGNASAIDQFANRMRATPGPKWRDLTALANSKSPRVVAPLVEVLKDPDPQNRAAAAEALGRVGRAEAVPHLRPLLDDPRGGVRASAAGALFQLGDSSGEALLRELASHEEATVRVTAATFLASQPDEAWKALARGLAVSTDPMVRLQAARLLAREDPELSRALFESLLADPNPVVQEEAGKAMAEAPSSNFTTLRRLLRHRAQLVRVGAAARLLVLTR